MDSDHHLLSVTVLNRDFVCSGITVFLMAFSLGKSLDFCGFVDSKSVTPIPFFCLSQVAQNFSIKALPYRTEQTVCTPTVAKQYHSSGLHPETRLKLHCPFPALALGSFLPLLNGGTVRTVALVLCLWYEVRLTDLALFFACRLHDLGKQFPICGKDCVFKIVAVDFVPTDALHAAMFLAVVQQKTIAVYIVAAKLFDEGVDPL